MKKIGSFKILQKYVKDFSKVKTLVIGDLILDEFLWGKASRISPEAPVPVVWVHSESFMPGGASNVANNINSLGGKVFLAGMVGMDDRGRILKEELSKKNIDIGGVVIDGERPTTLKTRVIAHNQQVVRIDREKIESLPSGLAEEMLDYVKKIINEIDCIIIEDYGKGVITPDLLGKVLDIAKRHKKIVTVDPKEENFSLYKAVTAITPNHYEAAQAAGIKIKDKDSIFAIGKSLLNKLKCEGVLITLGENGMQLFEKSGNITHIPTMAQEVYDVSGAGDTVIAAFTLGLGAGMRMADAAYVSNVAAGIVVGKVGIAVVTQDELIDRMGIEKRVTIGY